MSEICFFFFSVKFTNNGVGPNHLLHTFARWSYPHFAGHHFISSLKEVTAGSNKKGKGVQYSPVFNQVTDVSGWKLALQFFCSFSLISVLFVER